LLFNYYEISHDRQYYDAAMAIQRNFMSRFKEAGTILFLNTYQFYLRDTILQGNDSQSFINKVRKNLKQVETKFEYHQYIDEILKYNAPFKIERRAG
jgi:hypothetical protein